MKTPDAGFTVLGFPCNQFGQQEPGTDDEILEFATVEVRRHLPDVLQDRGQRRRRLRALRAARSRHKPGEGDTTDITWNFEKFLVGRDGAVLARFSPMVTPEEIAAELPQYL